MGKKKRVLNSSRRRLTDFFTNANTLEEFESDSCLNVNIAETATLANPKKDETQRLIFTL